MPKAKAKKRKTSSVKTVKSKSARKTVSRKSIDVKKNIQKPAAKKDKSKLAWQIALGIAAALLFLFIIAKFSASVTGNVITGEVTYTPSQIERLAKENCKSLTQPTLGEKIVQFGISSEVKIAYQKCIEAEKIKLELDQGTITPPSSTTSSGKPSGSFIVDGLGESKDWLVVIIGAITDDQIFISKIAFFILAFLFVWHFSGKLGFEEKVVFHIFLSLVLSILFTRWIVNEDTVRTVLVPYNAVGISLGSIVPFMLLCYVSFTLLRKKDYDIPRILLWIFFISWMVYMLIDLWYLEGAMVYGIVTVLSLLVLGFYPTLRREIIKKIIGKSVDNALAPVTTERQKAALTIIELIEKGMDVSRAQWKLAMGVFGPARVRAAARRGGVKPQSGLNGEAYTAWKEASDYFGE